MLVKKELEQIDVLKYPVLPRPKEQRSRENKYVAVAEVLELKRSGKVLIIDIFLREDKTLKLRFFSDGKTFLACKEWPVKKWEKRMPSNLLEGQYSYFDIEARESDVKIAHEILKGNQRRWHYVRGIRNEMESFASGISQRKQEQAKDRKYAKMESHFEMFPDYPADLKAYCETNVFGFTYIFLSKILKGKDKGKRKAVCGHCEHKYVVDKKERPGGNGTCPKCKMPGKYRAGWANSSHEDKASICIAHKVQDQLLIRWTHIIRYFSDAQYGYRFWDYYRNLHLHTPKGSVLYAYDYKCMMNWGTNWYRQKNGDTCHSESFVYANNLREVFGETYYHVDLQAGLQNAGKLSFATLLNNLRDFPAAEYLFKMGMPALASSAALMHDLGNRAGFTEVLGVNKQYLPMYRKYNVTILEHRIIKSSRTWVDEGSFLKLQALKPEWGDQGHIEDILETMSFERFVNYFSKQKAMCGRKKLTYYLTLYQDYMSMSESLKVDMSRKSIRFPKNIKEAHDLLLPRFNQVKHQVEDENSKQAMEKLYTGMKEYEQGDYRIVFPTKRSDFITEGQALNHCVGADNYYKNHLAGTRMIFFVRRAKEPEKPYFTMEIDMRELKIKQLYGFGDCSAPPEVRKFANEFLKKLKPNSTAERMVS